ncbi:hypothetical protein [Luteibacter sp.]|jgi:hypothetical protein|uniref:hypothetical protein n=1 Tax=Luteibacter sp. TaxID=1886636 RepID=UPI002F41B8BA
MAISGGQLRSFRTGWAIVLGNFGKGHYFRRIGAGDVALASCGMDAYVSLLYGIGTYETCRRCRKKHGAPPDRRTCMETLKEVPHGRS